MTEPSDTPEQTPPSRSEVGEVLPAVTQTRAIDRPLPVSLPAAVAAATGGFLLGVATFVLVRVLRRPRPTRLGGGRRGRRKGQSIDVAATRSFLVDIHLLDRR